VVLPVTAPDQLAFAGDEPGRSEWNVRLNFSTAGTRKSIQRREWVPEREKPRRTYQSFGSSKWLYRGGSSGSSNPSYPVMIPGGRGALDWPGL